MALKLLKHRKIDGKLTLKTGMRIGGSKEEIEIGGMDNPIIREPLTDFPYIPGSSLKGKLRSILEYKYGKVGPDGKPCGCKQPDCLVCRVFGPHMQAMHDLGPSRIIVRDAPLSEESKRELGKLQEKGLLFAEVKTENIIDRRTGVAAKGGLRTQERVPAGASFDFHMSLRIFEGDDEKKLLSFIEEGLKLLGEEYLGGSGTRGYGWVKVDYTIT
jgi:CRISPR-associated protein Csm3